MTSGMTGDGIDHLHIPSKFILMKHDEGKISEIS